MPSRYTRKTIHAGSGCQPCSSKKDSHTTWAPFVEFSVREVREKFRATALAAFDAYRAEAHE